MSSTTPIQIPAMFQPGVAGGALEARVYDPNMDIASVVTDAQAITVEASWYLEGGTVNTLSGTWTLQVVYESIGNGPDGILSASMTFPFVPNNDNPPHPLRSRYFGSVSIPAGTLALDGTDQRAFHLTALLTSKNGSGGNLFAAAYDLGIVQVVKP